MSTADYKIYLEYSGDTVYLPVNPESYQITHPADNSNYNVLDLGEIVVPRIPGLRKISWSGLFPGSNTDPYVSEFTPPEQMIEFFTNWQKDHEPGRFIASRYMEDGTPIFDSNIQVVMEDFSVEERGGETGDFYYTISLSEYRPYSVKKVALRIQNTQTKAATQPQREAPKEPYVGATVIANGPYWYTSQGSEPHGNFSNFQGKISRMVSAQYGIHVTTMDGGWRGWVSSSQVEVVG